MSHSAVLTFTARGTERIIREGGSQAWRVNVDRVKQTEYLVCTQNVHNGPWGGMDHAHRTAFLVGRIVDVIPSSDAPDRWLIQIDRYARIDLPEVWKRWRFPVRYTTLEEIGIDPNTLIFEPLSEVPSTAESHEEDEVDEEVASPGDIQSVADIRRLLAGILRVPEEKIDILVRY